MSELRPKVLRTFSESFKKEKVRMLEKGEITPTELRNLYGMSYSSIYRWKSKYGSFPANEKVVVEKESDSYRSSQLLKKIKDLEAMVGRVSMEVSYYKAVVEQASIAYKTDIEKKFASNHSSC